MALELQDARIYTDFQGLTALKRGARANSPEAARAVATQFEALFAQMMLKSMREAAPGGGLFDSPQLHLYRDLFDKQISMEIADRGDLGIGSLLLRQLAPPEEEPRGDMSTGFNPRLRTGPSTLLRAGLRAEPFATYRRQAPALAAEVAGTQDAQAVATGEDGAPGQFDSPSEFVRNLLPYAEAAGRKLGLSPDLLLAQAALETGWGQHIIRRHDGGLSHNLFGIKAGADWEGDSVSVSTLEFDNGIAHRRIAPFRAYGSFEESFNDYVEFLRGHPRYEAALARSRDPRAYITALHRAGYATDPRYAQKVLDIMRSEIRELKVAEARTLTDG